MKICISSGHGAKIEGAVGYIREHEEAVKVVDKVAQFLRAMAVEVETFEDKTSTTQDKNLSTLVNWHNASARGHHEYDISVHFNAGSSGGPTGTETYYGSPYSMAVEVSEAIAVAGDLKNRGAKPGGGLYFIAHTHAPALLLEICFVDSQPDVSQYQGNFDAICEAIASALSGTELPIEEPPPIEEQAPVNSVVMDGVTTGDVRVTVNGVTIREGSRRAATSEWTVTLNGDVALIINGEKFNNTPIEPAEPPIKANHRDVFATTFGGEADNEHSAYPPYDADGNGRYLDDTELYVSLPYSFPLDEPLPYVRVWNRATERSARGIVADKGPWVIDDIAFINSDARPLAETCYLDRTPLPRGPNEGQVPSNPAGIDLSPAMFRALGMTDNGPVDFVIEPEATV